MKNWFLVLFLLFFILSLYLIFRKPFSLGMDIAGGTILTYQIDFQNVKKENIKNILEQTKDLIERRINFLGVSEYSIGFSESGRILIEIPNIKDPDQAKKVIGETPFLEFRIPKNGDFVSSGLTGEYLVRADVVINPNTLEPIVSLQFNSQGAKIFKDLTQKYLNQPIAIYLDGKLISAPIVRDVIENGQAQITGKFTLDEAKLLANRLNQGALPAPLILIAESVVNPILSQKTLNLALKGSIAGIILVVLFMIIFYGFQGLIADLALIFFLVFNLALYKILGATISLASLSGLVLAIGMAVDANILIFERMKEEKKRGLRDIDIVKEGFTRAFPSIRDSNLTTIISSLLIYFLAVSFVKGFALTLFLGVVISFLTAVFFTHYLLETIYLRRTTS
ncbi:MAG: protein translocase subunit SecD [Candidatus Parcubacteria bacterium]|nr:MAG: protein translocase subunit SecD [Candidatus Parcubacteria bacterium]